MNTTFLAVSNSNHSPVRSAADECNDWDWEQATVQDEAAAKTRAAQVAACAKKDAEAFFIAHPPGTRLSKTDKLRALCHSRHCAEATATALVDTRTGAATGNEGFVYVLSNPAMPGILKIGKTSRPVAERVAELSGATGVALPFRVEFALRCDDHHAAERAAHLRLTAFRVNNGREFFKCDVQAAIATITAALGGSAVLA